MLLPCSHSRRKLEYCQSCRPRLEAYVCWKSERSTGNYNIMPKSVQCSDCFLFRLLPVLWFFSYSMWRTSLSSLLTHLGLTSGCWSALSTAGEPSAPGSILHVSSQVIIFCNVFACISIPARCLITCAKGEMLRRFDWIPLWRKAYVKSLKCHWIAWWNVTKYICSNTVCKGQTWGN